ncbi:MAG TPA: alpha/beta fold hydrolase [Elusimicrobiota bacterium]|nr:alpha/beta fold hydrolase [Elusimicrobiota bacterium]
MEFKSHGTTLFYEEAGLRDGEPIVFVHGFPFTSRTWTPQVQALKGRYRIITFDNRGHGRSQTGDGQYPFEFFVDDLIQMLHHLQLSRIAICGLSMGGYIILRALERDASRFRAAVLCDTRSEADSNETKLKRAEGVRIIKEEGLSAYAKGFVKGVISSHNQSARPELVRTVTDIILSNSAPGIAAALLAMAGRTDTTASLSRIRIPVMILVGADDAATPVQAARSMHDRIPGSRLAIIPDAGHLSNLENDATFNEHLLNFLTGLESSRRPAGSRAE